MIPLVTNLFSEIADRLPTRRKVKRGLPGYIATTLMILVTALWSIWSIGEMYWEGWWGPVQIRLLYLIPGAACLALTLAALTWPRLGGWLVIVIGGLFTIWWSELELRRLIVLFPVSGVLVIIGVLFLLEARHRRLRRAEGWLPPRHWLLRNACYVLAVTPSFLILVGFCIYWLPVVMGRIDDGDRGARLIVGNQVSLIWAPEGPGWNWKQPWGGYASWNSLFRRPQRARDVRADA